MSAFDPASVRPRFPALAREVNGRPAAYLDGPGGTQVPQEVIDAIGGVLARGVSNLGGMFAASREAKEITAAARSAMADLFNAGPEEIVFGQNMTSLTFAVSRALARTWTEGDEIVVTRLDHDANITPWTMAAAECGVTVRWLDFDPGAGCALDPEDLAPLLGPRTRLVAVTLASNAVGTVVDVGRVVELAHAAGALVYVDAVHYTPHGVVDVAATDCDFLVASSYKFYGPHLGVLYGKHEHLARFDAYRVRPAPDRPPGKWESGTQSFEAMAGVTAAVDYLAGLGGPGAHRRAALVDSFGLLGAHEGALGSRFLAGVAEIPGVTVHGIIGPGRRTPTFALAVGGRDPREVQREMGAEGIFVWAGHYYAVAVMERLGVLDAGGLLRVGFSHYNTADEVDRVLGALERAAAP